MTGTAQSYLQVGAQALDDGTGTGLGSAAAAAVGRKDAEAGLSGLGETALAAAAAAAGPYGLAAYALCRAIGALLPFGEFTPLAQETLGVRAWAYIEKNGGKLDSSVIYTPQHRWRVLYRVWLARHMGDAKAGLGVLGMADRLTYHSDSWTKAPWPYPRNLTLRMLWEDFYRALGAVEASAARLRVRLPILLPAPPRASAPAARLVLAQGGRASPSAASTTPAAFAGSPATATPTTGGGGGGGSSVLLLAGAAALLFMASRAGSTKPRSS